MRILERLHQYLDKLDIRTILRRTSSRGEDTQQVIPKEKKRAPNLTDDKRTQIEDELTAAKSDFIRLQELLNKLEVTESQLRGYLSIIGIYIVSFRGNEIWIKNRQSLQERVNQLRQERIQKIAVPKKVSTEADQNYVDLRSGYVSDEEVLRRIDLDRGEE